MAFKKNILTGETAGKILKRLEKKATPSARMKKYVHETLLRDSHFIFQFKKDNKRWAYCTHCKKEWCIETSTMRTVHPADVNLLKARHNNKVFCPKCKLEVTKRYAGYNHNNVYANVAEFGVDKETGGLYWNCFEFMYEYSMDWHVKEPRFVCYNVFFFNIHQWFYLLHGGFDGTFIYTGDKYNSCYYTIADRIGDPFCKRQWECEGIHIIKDNFKNAWKKSALKYSCIDLFFKNDIRGLFKYLIFYCSYPEICEKLVKEGYDNYLREIIYGIAMKGCINFRAKNTRDFFKLSGNYYKLFKDNAEHGVKYFCYKWIKAIQYMQHKGVKPHAEFYKLLGKNWEYEDCITRLRKYLSPGKVCKYVEQQALYCKCRYAPVISETDFFINYKDYINMCKKLNYDLKQKPIAVPQNVFLSHNELSDVINTMAAEEKKIMKEEFEKRLKMLKRRFCFEYGGLLIRPAESFEELEIEGHTLHHCVSTYAEKHFKGQTTIFFIRRKDEPSSPYYTLEYHDGRVIQCRTVYNGAQTDEVKAFIAEWEKYILNTQINKIKEIA